jgi:Lon protease-like protein
MLLPLHIFESRYRDMVADTLSGEMTIGMALLRGDWQGRYYQRPEIFATGTGARIVRHERLANGRYNILVAGLREFEVREEHDDRSYRYARVAWREEADSRLSENEHRQLVVLARSYLERRPNSAWAAAVGGADPDHENLVNALCQTIQIPPVERLWLLEATDLRERGRRLRELLEFGMEEAKPSAGARGRWTH